MAKPCQRDKCSQQAAEGFRYCHHCKKDVLHEMAVSGYLETRGYGHKGQSRTGGMKEDQRETKYGADG